MRDFLPPQFDAIASLVTNVHKKTATEYSSSCPKCGGKDRFVMFLVSRHGYPLGWCRQCQYRWTPKEKNQPTKDQIAEWRAMQIEVEKARIQAAQRSLEILQHDHMWTRFHDQNNDWSRQTFRSWGLSDTWIDYLKLGLVPEYIVYARDTEYYSPAFTIPIWNVGGVVQNIKLRIANPREASDRYRNYYPMGSSFLFVPNYDLELKGACVLVEGEKKAALLEQTLDDPDYRVVGLQTKSPASELFDQLKDFEVVYIALDPDAFQRNGKEKETAVERITRMIGKERSRIVHFPCKPDDGILAGMNPRPFIRMAERA